MSKGGELPQEASLTALFYWPVTRFDSSSHSSLTGCPCLSCNERCTPLDSDHTSNYL